MLDSHSAIGGAESPLISSSELGSPLLITDEQTGKLTPVVKEDVCRLINGNNPAPDLPQEVLGGLAKLEKNESDQHLISLVDAMVAEDEKLMKIRAVANSLHEIASDRIANLKEEIKGFREERRWQPFLRRAAAAPVGNQRWNLNFLPLVIFLALASAVWFCFQTEWSNAVVVALNSSMDFGEQPGEQKENATLFVFCVVAMPAIIFKVIDLLLPWRWRITYRLFLGGLGGLGVLALIYEWGLVAGGGHGDGGPMGSLTVTENNNTFFMLQTGVFAIGTFLLTIPTYWAWMRVQSAEYLSDQGRDACNQFAGEKENEWAGWIGLSKTSQELLIRVTGVRNKLLETCRSRIANERKRFQLQRLADETQQKLRNYDLPDHYQHVGKEVFESRNGAQPAI